MPLKIEKIAFEENNGFEYIAPTGRRSASQAGYQPVDFNIGERVRVYFQRGGGNSLSSGQIQMREGVVLATSFRKQRRVVFPPNIALQMQVDKSGVNTSDSPNPPVSKSRKSSIFYDLIGASYRIKE